VHYFRYGKGQLALQRREQAFAEASRKRSEARDARIARENAEKAARRSQVRQTHAPKVETPKVDVPKTDADKAVGETAESKSVESKE